MPTAIFNPIADFFGQMLALIYNVVPSLGWSIVILTVVVMLVLFPLTAKQTKSMLAMQQLQPQIKALQAKHKGDKQKLNEEMMKFYQENKVNPLAGCWPLLVQMPLLFALFTLMREPQNHLPASSKLFAALCEGASKADCSAAIKASGFPSTLDFLGLNLHFSAKSVSGGLLAATPYFLMVLASIGAQFFQSVQAQRGQEMNAQMKIVSRVLPVAFGFMYIAFPAGTVLYALVSSLFRIGQQEIILRKITLPHRARMASESEAISAAPTTDVVEGETTPRPKKRKRKK